LIPSLGRGFGDVKRPWDIVIPVELLCLLQEFGIFEGVKRVVYSRQTWLEPFWTTLRLWVQGEALQDTVIEAARVSCLVDRLWLWLWLRPRWLSLSESRS
jgi:hypothetical protein